MENSPDKMISCICITHNRLDMFQRALRCFQAQRYENRELVVLFENDIVTEQFVQENEAYNYCELIDKSETAVRVEINSSSVAEGVYLSIVGPENLKLAADAVTWMDVPDRTSLWEVSGWNGKNFILRSETGWLAKPARDGFELISDPYQATRFELIKDLDSNWLLRVSPSSNGVKQIGWETQIVRHDPLQKITFFRIVTRRKLTLGMKRNLAIRAAKGDFISVWDDDDWYSEWRLFNQMSFLQYTGKLACSLACTVFYDHNNGKIYLNLLRVTGHENTLLFKKTNFSFYDNLNTGEDTPLLLSFYNMNQLAVMDDPFLYVYNFHRKNSCSEKHFNIIISTSTPLPDETLAWANRVLAE
jgi:glycosyltransferase involved in cell wall biosynthesis